MCARLGVRVAYSQAYRPQANGKAEVAGKSLIAALRKVHTQDKICWPEALPRVLWAYHNAPGEAGLSPFQIMFGRDRFDAGMPLDLPHECESAVTFFERQKQIDEKVANRLKQMHTEEEKVYNAKHAKKPPFLAGDSVWVLRTRNSPSYGKLDTWWVGPCRVVERVGDQSYRVQVKPTSVMDVHASQMKLYTPDRIDEDRSVISFFCQPGKPRKWWRMSGKLTKSFATGGTKTESWNF